MKEIYRNSTTVIYETESGATVGICEDENRTSFKKYYHVVVREKGASKGKTVKTRCTFETAYSIAQQY